MVQRAIRYAALRVGSRSVTMQDRLFSESALSDFLSQRENEMYEDPVLKDSDAASNGVDEVSARLREKYSLKTVAVDRDGTHTRQEQDPDDEGLKVVFFVPFTGSHKLLDYRPNSLTPMVVDGKVQDNEIVFAVIGTLSNEAAGFQRKFDRWFDNMKEWLDGANKQADDFNSSLHSKIKAKIADRAERIRRANEVMSGLDFPETPADSEVKSNGS